MTEARIPAKPLPRATKDSEEFWAFTANGELMLRICNACGNKMYYPRVLCTKCMSLDLGWEPVSGRAVVHAFTIIYRPPSPVFLAEVPYILMIAALEEGPRLMSNLIDCPHDMISIGMPVELYLEPAGEGISLPKFRPRKT